MKRHVANTLAAVLAERSKDAWSVPRYVSWKAVAKALLLRGYTPIAAEAILRSKLTRWAADARTQRGRASVVDLLRYLDRFPAQVSSLLYEEGLASRPAENDKAVVRR
jgi:hypothetical protein